MSIELTAVIMDEVNIADNIYLSDLQIVNCITKQKNTLKVKSPQSVIFETVLYFVDCISYISTVNTISDGYRIKRAFND